MDGCHILLKWNLPSGVYVDPYQLPSTNKNVTARFTTPVDVEQMAHKAEPLLIYTQTKLVCSNSLCRFQISLPVHARYHLPKLNGGQTIIFLLAPIVYSSCSTTCHSLFDEKSNDWNLIDIEGLNSLSISIPIGDLSHTTLVTLFTGIATFFSICWAVITLKKY